MGSHRVTVGKIPTPIIAVTNRSATTVSLSWSLPRSYSKVSQYIVERGTDGTLFPNTVYTGLALSTEDSVTPVSGQTLYYRVRFLTTEDKYSDYSRNASNTVYAPIISNGAPTQLNFTSVGGTYNWSSWVSDQDSNEILRYSLPSKFHPNISIDEITGIMTVPSSTSGQQGSVTVQVTDKYGLVDTHSCTVNTAPVGNRAPSFALPGAVAPTTATVFSGGSIQFTAIDPDYQAISYSLVGSPAGYYINPTTGLVTVTGTTSLSITVNASDGELSTDTTCAVTVQIPATTSESRRQIYVCGNQYGSNASAAKYDRLSKYDVLITQGYPDLSLSSLQTFCNEVLSRNPNAKIYIYVNQMETYLTNSLYTFVNNNNLWARTTYPSGTIQSEYLATQMVNEVSPRTFSGKKWHEWFADYYIDTQNWKSITGLSGLYYDNVWFVSVKSYDCDENGVEDPRKGALFQSLLEPMHYARHAYFHSKKAQDIRTAEWGVGLNGLGLIGIDYWNNSSPVDLRERYRQLCDGASTVGPKVIESLTGNWYSFFGYFIYTSGVSQATPSDWSGVTAWPNGFDNPSVSISSAPANGTLCKMSFGGWSNSAGFGNESGRMMLNMLELVHDANICLSDRANVLVGQSAPGEEYLSNSQFNINGQLTRYWRFQLGSVYAITDFSTGISKQTPSQYFDCVVPDEMRIDLGQPLEACGIDRGPEAGGYYKREFENGIWYVNPPTGTTQSVTLPSAGSGKEWQRINAANYGNQDPTVNNGVVQTNPFTLRKFDAILFLRSEVGINTTFSGLSTIITNTYGGPGDYAVGIERRLDGVDASTGEVFSASAPSFWGAPVKAPYFQALASGTAVPYLTVDQVWNATIRTDVGGPDGVNSVLRITRNRPYVQPDQYPYEVWPAKVLSTQGMVYMRIKLRYDPTYLGNMNGYFNSIFGAKFNDAGENQPRLAIGIYKESGIFYLNAQARTGSGSIPPVLPWPPGTICTPTPYSNDNSSLYSRGVVVPNAAGPEPDWGKWWTFEIAFRAHDCVSGKVAGNAPKGWFWCATSQGTTTAAAPNGTGTQRFYVSGANVFSGYSGLDPVVKFIYPFSHYQNDSNSGKWKDIGRFEMYESWPSDASSHPADAV